MKRFLFLELFTLFFAVFSNAQTFKFKHYGIEEGLCHNFIYSLNQDKNGYLWIGTGDGLCRYDGINFVSKFRKEAIPTNIVNKIFKDKSGDLWFGYDDGTITFFNGVHFTIINPKEQNSSVINDVCEDEDENLYFATQNSGIVRVTPNHKFQKINSGLTNQLIYSLIYLGNRQFLMGTQNGLYFSTLNQKEGKATFSLQAISQIPFTKIQCIVQKKHSNTFWIGTEDAGIFQLNRTGNNFNAFNLGTSFGLMFENIQNIFQDNGNNLWLSTFDKGVFKINYSPQAKTFSGITHFDGKNGLSSEAIKQVFQDREGNIWIGTYGNGMERMIDEVFTAYHFDKTPLGKNILSITCHKSTIWVGGEKVIMKAEEGFNKKAVFYTTSNGLPADNITALYEDGRGTLWIGTENNGLYSMNEKGNRIKKVQETGNSLENSINHISGKGEMVWVSTKGGLFVFNLKNNHRDHYGTLERLPHNDIKQVFNDSQNDLWLATKSNCFFSLQANSRYNPKAMGEFEMQAITEDSRHNLWAATYGDGLIELSPKKFTLLNTEQGLKSDYCYCIIFDGKQNILTGHRMGISKVNIFSHQVKTYGMDAGIVGDCNYNAVAKSQSGSIYFGTTNGVVRYNPDMDKKNNIAPIPNITGVTVSDKPCDFTEKVVLPYGIYKLRIDYVGINFKSPELVKYRYKLEGYDLNWSEMTSSRYALFSRIEDGRYTFLLKAYNSDGICSQQPLRLTLIIKPPFWKTWWFICLALVFLVTLVYSIIKARERKQKQIQEYLKKLLDERTREVVEQKEVIELKNRDITDSINYAQRIQACILPSVSKLEDNFSGSFVYYKPRDIVSGDFYWFDKIDTDRFIIVCADSTGHGVPGAFMSMIGTTLIKDICLRKNVTAPSDILYRLDTELKSTLNQNIDAEKSNDGMDIIVCEINTSNYHVRIASAMRPVIIFKEGQELYSKGSRTSVGGDYVREEEKNFKEDEFDLNKGDLIYMFSDGYPDQFGGPMGKKFKMVRLKNLFKEIYQLPMDEQFEQVKSTFENWKEDYDQIDDVLVMGIKL
ncbi:MAG: two-component regulator propeller domain-containing protein [Bacteroidota bacterium]|nr:two-component regulator propeller domain-containing protein [Bacteroidota bacterium]